VEQRKYNKEIRNREIKKDKKGKGE